MKCRPCPVKSDAKNCQSHQICIKTQARIIAILAIASILLAIISYLIDSDQALTIGIIGIFLSIVEGIGLFIRSVVFHFSESSSDPPGGG